MILLHSVALSPDGWLLCGALLQTVLVWPSVSWACVRDDRLYLKAQGISALFSLNSTRAHLLQT